MNKMMINQTVSYNNISYCLLTFNRNLYNIFKAMQIEGDRKKKYILIFSLYNKVYFYYNC